MRARNYPKRAAFGWARIDVDPNCQQALEDSGRRLNVDYTLLLRPSAALRAVDSSADRNAQVLVQGD
jgi:hypothetical protein